MIRPLIAPVTFCLAFAALVAGAVGAPSAAPKASASHVVSITMPAAVVDYKPGANLALVQANCAVCHGADYVYNQPPLTKAQWTGEVLKMRNAYKATIPDDAVEKIVEYLMAQNGKVASAPAPTAVVAQSATPAPAPAGAAAAIVQAKGFKFLPASLTVAAGTTVTFVNEDEAQHSFTAVDKTNGKPNFDSGELSKGGKWTHVFAKAGTYEYFCDDHAFMKGKIVVTAPSS